MDISDGVQLIWITQNEVSVSIVLMLITLYFHLTCFCVNLIVAQDINAITAKVVS